MFYHKAKNEADFSTSLKADFLDMLLSQESDATNMWHMIIQKSTKTKISIYLSNRFYIITPLLCRLL